MHCCRNRSSDNYIVKQRYNPTFVHQPIFQSSTMKDKQPRFSKTFYSSALDTQGYNVKTLHSRHQNNEAQSAKRSNPKVIYTNYSHERRLQDLYPKTGFRFQSKDKWYDHTKQQFLNTIRNCHNTETLRQRKILQLASAPVFTDFDYQSRTANPQITQVFQVSSIQNPEKQTSPQFQKSLEMKESDQKVQKTKKNQILNKDIHDNNQSVQKTKKDFHKNCFPKNQEVSQTNKHKEKMKKSHSLSKPKTVSKNPTFSLVRGNKIDNRL